VGRIEEEDQMNFFKNIVLPNKHFALANRFTIQIPGLEVEHYQVESVSAPGVGIGTSEYPLNGWQHQVKTPTGYIYEDATVVFREIDYSIYDFFKAWQKEVIDDDYKLHYPGEYTREVGIYQLDHSLNVIKQITLEEAWPTTINNFEFSSSSENTITTLTVTLAYKNMS
jgi:hypothetical protein